MSRVSRRTLLAAAAGTAMVGLTPGSARAATEGWWHTPGYTVGNSGFSQHEKTILASTVGRVTPKGTLLDGSTGLTAPVLDKGRIFAADASGITAIGESTGERLWRYEYPVPANKAARLVIKDGVLTAGWGNARTSPAGSDISVVTLDAATGGLIAEAAPVWYGTFVDLLVDRDSVAVTLSNNRSGLFTLVLRLSDLAQVWPGSYHWTAAPAVASGKVLLRSAHYHSTEIRDLATGATVWSAGGPEYMALAANDAGTTFYVAWGHSLQIVDATTGVAKWLASDVTPREITVTPSRLYVSHLDKKVSAFDATTDRPVFWSRTFAAQPLKPIIAGGVLYVTVPGDRVHALDPITGNTITTPAFTGVTALPVITNGRIYLTDGTKITTYGL